MRALLIDSLMPSPADSGRFDSLQYVKALEAAGVAVDIMTLQEDPSNGSVPIARHVGVFPEPAGARAWLWGNAHFYDVIFVCRIVNFVNLEKPLGEFRSQGGKLVFVTVDLHHLREFRLATLGHSPSGDAALELAETALRELRAIRTSDAAIVVSEFERRYLSVLGVREHVWHIPLGRPVANEPAGSGSIEPELIFVGSFAHQPNRVGLEWFLRELWEDIRADVPGVLLNVVGELSEGFASGNYPSLAIHGWVDNLSPIYARAWASIAPIQAGAGLKGKVVGSLAEGVPVLGSRTALEGMPAPEVDGVLTLCEDARDYVTALSRLADRRDRLASRIAALEYARANFSLELFENRVRALLTKLVDST